MLSTPSSVPAADSHPPENVYHALGEWSRSADGRLLVAWAVVGCLDAAAIAVLLPAWWLAAMPLVSLSSLGVWGLATRRARALAAARPSPRVRLRVLSLIEAASVVIGTLAALMAFYGAFLLGLGRRWGVPGG